MRVLYSGVALFVVLVAGCQAAETDSAEKGWEIFQQARAAAGADRVELHDYSYQMTTELEMQGRQVRMASRVQAVLPDVFRQEIQGGAGTMAMIVAGDTGWRRQAGAKQPLEPDAVERLQADLARAHVLFGEPPPASSVRYRGREEFDGREVDVIEIGSVGDTPLRLWIDPATYDVVKTVHVGDVPGGGMAQVDTLLSDYVEVGGLRLPRTRVVMRNGAEATRQTRANIEVNQGLTRDQLVQ